MKLLRFVSLFFTALSTGVVFAEALPSREKREPSGWLQTLSQDRVWSRAGVLFDLAAALSALTLLIFTGRRQPQAEARLHTPALDTSVNVPIVHRPVHVSVPKIDRSLSLDVSNLNLPLLDRPVAVDIPRSNRRLKMEMPRIDSGQRQVPLLPRLTSRDAFRFTLLGLGALVAANAVWAVMTQPVEQKMSQVQSVEELPQDWQDVRQRTEYSQIARAGLAVLALCSLTVATMAAS